MTGVGGNGSDSDSKLEISTALAQIQAHNFHVTKMVLVCHK